MSNHDISQFEYMEKTGNSGYIVVINGEKKVYDRSNSNHSAEINYLDSIDRSSFDNAAD